MSKLTEPGVSARLKSKRAAGQARALRRAMTPAEKTLWRELREHPLANSHWRKQTDIGPYIVDFVCHGGKLIVELDGGVHDEEQARERDHRRQEFLQGRGYRVVRFSNADVTADAGLVVRTILAEANIERPTIDDLSFARSLLLHEDAHILVFNKPAGLAVQGGSGVEQSLEDLLAAFAKSNGKRPRLVHRLDRDTSGVIVVARTKPAAAFLSAAFAGRDAKKTYFAIVCGGAPDPREGAIDTPLKKASRKGLDIMEVAHANEAGAQGALTRYRTLADAPGAALVELSPETGRMHQLRAHLASVGRPIAGDAKYGGLFRLGSADIPGLMLHAAALDIPHPAGGRAVFSAPAPEAFKKALRSLGLEAAPPA